MSETTGLLREGHTDGRVHSAAEPAQGYVTARGIWALAAQASQLWWLRA